MNDTTPNRSIGHVLFIMGGDRIKFEDGAINPIVGWGTRLETIGTYHGKEYNGELNIGTGCSFGLFCHIAAAEKITIGRDVMFASFVTVLDHNHGHGDLSRPPRYQPLQCKPVTIGDNCWIGEHVYIGPGVKIGHDSVIGANSVVLDSVPPYSSVKGAPAKAVQRRIPERKTTCIVIPSIGYPGITECIQSIKEHTHGVRTPYRIIVVADGLDAGEELDTLRIASDATCPNIWEYVEVHCPNFSHRGFAATVNEGLRIATGGGPMESDSYVCILNDDTKVTPYWLERLIGTMEHYPRCGIVGPMSNFIAGPQQIDPPQGPYSLREHYGQTQLVPNVMGVCMLIRQTVFEKVGFFDERFGIGNFEDNDFCRRALQYDWDIRIVKDAFVHHEGNQSFKLLKVDYAKLLEENRKKYLEKWSNIASASDI